MTALVNIKTYLNRFFTGFKEVRREDEYTVCCINGSFYPKYRGQFFIDYPYGVIGFKNAPDAEDSVIGFPSNSIAMEFINQFLKTV